MIPLTANSPLFINHGLKILLGFCAIAFLTVPVANGQTQGFTEPFKRIDLSSDESGAISAVYVEEGQRVSKNDIVARLDNRVQLLQLEIATKMAEAKSQLVAAEQTYVKRKLICSRLEELKSKGHATTSEIIRAQMELSIAYAKFLAAQEDQVIREIEQRRAEVQLERRNIRAPFDGIVSKIHRREGEFLSPLRPELVTIVQIDRLLATFAVPRSQIGQFEIGKTFHLKIAGAPTLTGTVHSIGVEADAQSGTVLIKMVVDNEKLEIRSGEICLLNI